MARVIDTPEFKSEREEADWWFENQHLIDDMFEEEYGSIPTDFVAADVAGEDARILREQAALAGVQPHIYAARLLHDALHRHLAA